MPAACPPVLRSLDARAYGFRNPHSARTNLVERRRIQRRTGMASKVTVDVSHGQLAVFASSLQHPFNDWTDRHVAQGFSWRPGSVSFLTLVESGLHSIEIKIVEYVGALHGEAVRAIDVPFEVPPDGAIDVGSISNAASVSLRPGPLLLRCEFLGRTDGSSDRVRLIFATKDTGRVAVVRADKLLSVDGELLMSAEAAIS